MPRGSTATIAEFLTTSSASATIAGTIAGLVGGAEGSRATLDDGTGHLAVWCPRGADPFFAVRIRESVEIDVVRSPGTAGGSEADLDRQHAMIQNAVVRGDGRRPGRSPPPCRIRRTRVGRCDRRGGPTEWIILPAEAGAGTA